MSGWIQLFAAQISEKYILIFEQITIFRIFNTQTVNSILFNYQTTLGYCHKYPNNTVIAKWTNFRHWFDRMKLLFNNFSSNFILIKTLPKMHCFHILGETVLNMFKTNVNLNVFYRNGCYTLGNFWNSVFRMQKLFNYEDDIVKTFTDDIQRFKSK